MKLAISHLACDDASQIASAGVSLIECVFSKTQPIMVQNASSIAAWKKQLPIALTPYSVQSITYGCGLADFSACASNFAVMDKIIELATSLQLKRLVFGSPNIRRGRPDASMFKYIDEQLKGSDMVFCIEPNARAYGGEYFFDVEEIAEFLQQHKFSNISTMVDTHNSWLEHRRTCDDIFTFRDVIDHVHASEVKLQGFTSVGEHANIAQALSNINYQHVVTFESLTMQGLDDFKNIYGK
jgi:sugar phosphate isomerase/epimerase